MADLLEIVICANTQGCVHNNKPENVQCVFGVVFAWMIIETVRPGSPDKMSRFSSWLRPSQAVLYRRVSAPQTPPRYDA
jgi:hypothetical protein